MSAGLFVINTCSNFNRAIGGEVTTDGDYLIFEGNRYSRKGFLHKAFITNAVVR